MCVTTPINSASAPRLTHDLCDILSPTSWFAGHWLTSPFNHAIIPVGGARLRVKLVVSISLLLTDERPTAPPPMEGAPRSTTPRTRLVLVQRCLGGSFLVTLRSDGISLRYHVVRNISPTRYHVVSRYFSSLRYHAVLQYLSYYRNALPWRLAVSLLYATMSFQSSLLHQRRGLVTRLFV